jgi:3-oxoacyl-[acyl-carrier protein] reductase
MYMGRIGTSAENEIVHELQGARVLLTGLTASAGVDVARAFADLKSRLIVHTNDLSPEVTEVVALLSQSAREIKLYTNSIADADAAVLFAQSAAQAYGGLDAVINLSRISSAEVRFVETEADAEKLIADKLTPLAHLTDVAGNRMRVVLSEGVILNVLQMEPPVTRRDSAVASLMRTALAAMTKTEAHRWAEHGIRVNAIAPHVVAGEEGLTSANISSEPNMAALAVFLTSRYGAELSGHMFDCDGVA